ncbi:substrate-binding periplasmic protein [Sediminispirochaeta bajacaliforniensis]|uniref:substrate-binding periplasmic protein n=1 Tax=Sediminispirochaeta bajacaliforniensis TaxID=148 RepID=UPI000364C1F4|nr:transporter substrate-binding domain-containing protein [Sediminispirochaeta bajacaliforniensis]
MRRLPLLFIFFLLMFPISVASLKAESLPPLILSTADTPPFSKTNDMGYYDLIIREAFTRIGRRVTILHLPSDRSLAEAASGNIDGEYARTEGMEKFHPHLILVPEKLSDFNFSAFTCDSAISVASWDDLAAYHVIFINGWKIFEEHVTDAKSIVTTSNETSLFSMLVAGRADIILYNDKRGEYYLRTHDIKGVRILFPPLAQREMYLYLHDRHASLVEPLAEALAAIKEEGLAEHYVHAAVESQNE